jgi:hypothetical protein
VTVYSNPTRVVGATVAQLQQHARDLAAAFSIRLVETTQVQPHEAFAAPHLRLVVATPVVDETTYAVQLHEMGHLCSPLGAIGRGVVDADVSRVKQLEEDAAWTWARHYALDWTPAMDAVATWAEGTYHAAPAQQPPTRKPQPQIDWSRYR